jgi:hypothetical protein
MSLRKSPGVAGPALNLSLSMAFSLKSLFRRESSDPSLTDENPAIGNESMRAPALTDPADPSHPRHSPFSSFTAATGPVIQERQDQPISSPFQVATTLPQPAPMNIASPFQPTAEEGFTIRELSILLPPQLLSTGNLPPDYLVPLPVEALRSTFLAGRPCLRLSQVFAACPYLFSRQLMPGEDQEVALPYQKVRRILEGNQIPLPPARAAAVESPFSIRQAPPEQAPEVLSPLDSPFLTAAPAQRSPFQAVNPEPVAAASPFALAQPPVPVPVELPAPPANLAQPASPFQFAPKLPGAVHPDGAPPSLGAPASPFSLGERLPTPAAVPAPHSSSPFQVVQPAAVPANQAGSSHMSAELPATPFAVSAPAPMPGPPASAPGSPAASPFATQGGSPFQVISPAPQPVAAPLPMPIAPAPAPASPFALAPAMPRIESPPVPEPRVPPAALIPASAPAVADLHPLQAPGAIPRPLPASVPVQYAPVPQPPPMSAPAMEAAPVQPAPSAPAVVQSAPPAATLPATAPEEEVGEVSLRLVSVLRSVSVEMLGFDAANVPDSVLVIFPLSLIRPQLATGRVQVSLSDITAGVAEKFRPAFARAQPNLVATLPLSELFHALPSAAIPTAAPVPAALPSSFFETPFANRATEDATRIPTPAPAAPEPVATQVAPLELPPLLIAQAAEAPAPLPTEEVPLPPLLPSFITAHDDLGAPQPASILVTPPPSHLPLRGALAPAPEPAPLTIDLPELSKPVGYLPPLPMPPAPEAPAPASRPELPVEPQVIPRASADLVPSPVQPLASVPEAILATGPAAPTSQDFQFGYREHPAHMSLRHWLQATGEMSSSIAVEHIAKLTGVRAAVLMEGAVCSTGGGLAPGDAAFFDKAGLRYQSLKMMLENMGQPVQGSFTMRLDNVASTFFLEEKICLAVLQDEASLADEMRDKLTLVTRELASLSK